MALRRGRALNTGPLSSGGSWGIGALGPQFCGALCKGVTQRLPAGGLVRCKSLAGSGAEPRRQTHFRKSY